MSTSDEPNLPKVSVTCGTKYQDVFDTYFRPSAQKFLAGYPVYIVVNMDGPGVEIPPEWNRIEGLVPYCGARNGNLLVHSTQGDLFCCSDDITFSSSDTIAELQRLAYSDPKIGLIAPQVSGATGNPMQFRGNSLSEEVVISERYIPFICFYIKREVLDKVGDFDEQYTEYGPDDVDYCLRIKQAGYKLALTPNVVIQHAGTVSHNRDRKDMGAQLERMWALFEKKWGHRNFQ